MPLLSPTSPSSSLLLLIVGRQHVMLHSRPFNSNKQLLITLSCDPISQCIHELAFDVRPSLTCSGPQSPLGHAGGKAESALSAHPRHQSEQKRSLARLLVVYAFR